MNQNRVGVLSSILIFVLPFAGGAAFCAAIASPSVPGAGLMMLLGITLGISGALLAGISHSVENGWFFNQVPTSIYNMPRGKYTVIRSFKRKVDELQKVWLVIAKPEPLGFSYSVLWIDREAMRILDLEKFDSDQQPTLVEFDVNQPNGYALGWVS